MIMGGVEMDYRDYWGRTPLHVATTRSAMGVVDLMIKMNVDPNPIDRYSEITPLHLSAGSNNIIIVKRAYVRFNIF
jgi:ankyrin repeat protein